MLAGVVRAALDEQGGNSATRQRVLLSRIASYTSTIEQLYPTPAKSAARGYYRTPDDFFWGGPEELVIAKGSDWCYEVARVCCALCQVAGMAARIIYAFSETGGHAVVEAYCDDQWTLADALLGRVYTDASDRGVSSVRMQQASDPERRVILAGIDSEYARPETFRHMAFSDYGIADSSSYLYGFDRCNDYYRAILRPVWNGGALSATPPDRPQW